MTVLELIQEALLTFGAIGAGQTPPANITTSARVNLNMLLEKWLNMPTLAYTEQQSFSVVQSTYSYVVGSGQTWDGNKPLKITKAYIRDSDGYDHPLSIITEDEYMEIYDKDRESRPDCLFYLPSNSTGTVYLYPSPDASYTIYIKGPKAFTAYTGLTTTIDLPAGYLHALKWNLAIELIFNYEREPTAFMLKMANDSLSEIKRTNLPKPRQLAFDGAFCGNGSYNINTGDYE